MNEPSPDANVSDAIRDLVRRGEIDEGAPAFNAALQVMHAGYGSLTRMQRKLYDRAIALQGALAKEVTYRSDMKRRQT